MKREDKVGKIRDAPRPRTKTEVRAFLGLVGYYCRSVPNFSAIAVLLSDPTEKNKSNVVRWSDVCEAAFQASKVRMSQQPVLRLLNLEESFVLRTDASNVGTAAVLLQGDEVLQPVSYASRKLSDAETKYHSRERVSCDCVGCPEVSGIPVGETVHPGGGSTAAAVPAASHLGEREADALRFVAPTFPVSAADESWHKNVGADYWSRAV